MSNEEHHCIPELGEFVSKMVCNSHPTRNDSSGSALTHSLETIQSVIGKSCKQRKKKYLLSRLERGELNRIHFAVECAADHERKLRH